MTCIVGMIKGNKVYMGADAAGVAGLDITVRADEKVFIRNKMIFGFTSSFRMGQLIRYKLRIPKHPANMATHEYMVKLFIESLRKCFRDGGFARNKDGEDVAGSFLVGYQGTIFEIDSDYQVGIPVIGVNSVGCGSSYAMGAMNAMVRCTPNKSPKEMILTALKIAEEHSAGVRGPFTVLELP